MCGIFGYVGAPVGVGPVVLEALRSMEYRGYDSWGTAFRMNGDPGRVIRRVGRVEVDAADDAVATSAIGHTRWATHGAVCERNAHPHLGLGGRIAVVHNGIVENADRLRQDLAGAVALESDTDSELMAHLVARHLRGDLPLREAVGVAFTSIEGNNAFVVLDRATGEIVVVASRLPIRLARTGDALVLASDPAALSGIVQSTIALPDDIAVSLGTPEHPSAQALELLDAGKATVVPAARSTTSGRPGASMRREIGEQPEVLLRIANDLEPISKAVAMARGATRIVFTGCGSASHAGMYAAELLADTVNHPEAIAVPASEIMGRPSLMRPGDVMVALTQSGETADVIDAVAVARERGARVIGLINAVGSTIEHLVDVVVPLHAGHERSVLATKSYMAMLGRTRQLVEGLAGCLGEPGEMERVAGNLQRVLEHQDVRAWVAGLASTLGVRTSAMIVSSGSHLPVALEAALKIKEGSYVHAEAVRTGELKHGTIALVDAGFPCVMLTPDVTTSARLRIAAEELVSRGAAVFWCGPGAPAILDGRRAPSVIENATPFEQTLVMQLVALETALNRGVDPDYPRNLAKSVTVR